MPSKTKKLQKLERLEGYLIDAILIAFAIAVLFAPKIIEYLAGY